MMNARLTRLSHLSLLCAAGWLTTATAAAQTVSEPRPPITVSIGGGTLLPYSYPSQPTADLLASVQIPISPSLFVEGQAIRSTSDHTRSGYFDSRLGRPFVPFTTSTTDHEALNVGGNLLMRTGGTALKLFFGGGFGWHHAETRTRSDTRCEPREPGGCAGQPDKTTYHDRPSSGPSWQVVGGVEGRIAPRLTAFGGARWLTTNFEAGDTGLGAMGGLRVALRAAGAGPSSTAPARSGPAVRLTMANGVRRTGELVSLTSSEVAIRDEGHTLTFPLDRVSRVERTTQHVRNGVLSGLIGGFIAGYLVSCGGGDEGDCWPEIGALVGGIGAGTGALIGASLNHSTKGSRVLYSLRF